MLKNDLNAFVDIRLENSYTKGKKGDYNEGNR